MFKVSYFCQINIKINKDNSLLRLGQAVSLRGMTI